MTEAELIELLQSGDAAGITAVLDRINGVGATDPAFLRAVDKRFADEHGGEYADLKDDPRIWQSVVEFDKKLAVDYPTASFDNRLDVVCEAARKKFGTPEQRAIRQMHGSGASWWRRSSLRCPRHVPSRIRPAAPAPRTREIAEMRKGRVGVPLSEIRRRRLGAGTDEQQE